MALEQSPAMALTLLALLIVAGIVLKGMTADERAKAASRAVEFAKDVKYALRTRPEETVFHDTLKERCPWAVATLALVTLNAVVFLFMLFGAGSLSDPKTLIGWGASIGPRTTNGEWWRLVSSMFVHAGLFQVLVTLAALLQVGSVVERLVGRETVTAAYFTSGVFAGLVNLSAHQAAVGFGASGAVFGIYGLFLAFIIWSRFHASSLTMPRPAVKKLVPAAVLFLIYSVSTDSLSGAAELTGLATGFIGGLIVMAGAMDPRPAGKRIGGVVGAAVVIVLASAFSLRGIADVWPELERIVASEDSAAAAYKDANNLFNKRRITADALAEMIDQTIIPELEASQERLKAIRKVPVEHQSLLDDANKYLGLRSESWRSRAEGLRKIELRALMASNQKQQVEVAVWRRRAEAQHRANLSLIGNAEGKAKAALDVLERIRTRLRGAPTPV